MPNEYFNPTYSTDHIWREQDMERCLSDDLNTIESNVTALQTGKAAADHTHTGYATASDVTALQTLVGDTSVATQISTAVATKADANHSHTEYAVVDHTHTGYAASTHSHSEYALATNVDALETKVGDSTVASQINAAVATKADANHTHNNYAAIDHTHTGYATETYVNTQVSGKVSQVEGMGLSTNDYTNAEKNKLAGIAENANNYILPTATSSNLGGVKIGSNITNSSGVISLSSDNVVSALGYTPFNGSNILSVAHGGTGNNIRLESVSVIHVNVTSNSATTCTYYPYLKMCFLRSFIELNSNVSAQTISEVMNIANTYRPSSITALSAFSASATVTAYIKRDTSNDAAPASVRIRSDGALSSGTQIYISGWFSSPYA